MEQEDGPEGKGVRQRESSRGVKLSVVNPNQLQFTFRDPYTKSKLNKTAFFLTFPMMHFIDFNARRGS